MSNFDLKRLSFWVLQNTPVDEHDMPTMFWKYNCPLWGSQLYKRSYITTSFENLKSVRRVCWCLMGIVIPISVPWFQIEWHDSKLITLIIIVLICNAKRKIQIKTHAANKGSNVASWIQILTPTVPVWRLSMYLI